MMTKTHAALSVAVTSFAMSTADPIVLYVAGFSSLLPDVDTSTSLLGRVFFPLSRWLERRFPHRTVTHSFLATVVVALLAWPLRWYAPPAWRAMVIGYFCGWFGDVFTKSGVAAFYPGTMARLVIPGNPRLRLSTGTRAEYFIFALLVGLIAVSIHLNSAGGLMRTFTALLGQPEGVVSLFQKEGARHRIIAHIEGRQNATASPVVADFEVVDVEGINLLVRNQQGTLYQAGNAKICPACHIHINRVKARTGAAIQTETHELRFRDQEIGEVLRALKVPAEASVTFTGELILKDAGLLAWPTSLQHFNAVQVSGSEETQAARTAKLRAASLDELKRLSEFFGSGNLLVKAVRDVR